MGNARGMYIETRRPLLVLDPNGMQVNLGRTEREDSPESAIPAIPYDAINVMPTPFGYKSCFYPAKFYRDNPESTDPVDGLDKVNFQDIFNYQTVNAYSITVGLAEGGIYLYSNYFDAENYSNDLKYWARVHEVFAESGVKYLWTKAVLDNTVYFYHQGENLLYAIMDWAAYQEVLANDDDAVDIYGSEDYQFGVIGKQPSFLNMAGQVGIFKADNRLGFWDTDGSVGWSSALNKFDFKPDATTFAGNTKFTAVAGNITTIKQAGRGFIIYATASITLILPASSSERWSATPISKDIGVLYETQVAVSPTDTIQYFWATSGGIYMINGNAMTPYEFELSSYFRKLAPVVGLKMLCGTYLAVDISDYDVIDSGATRFGRLVFDGKGNPFITNPPPTFEDPNYNAPFPMSLILEASGAAPNPKLEEYEPTGEQFPNVDDSEALIPCYTGWTFTLPAGITDVNSIGWSSTAVEALSELGKDQLGDIPGWTWLPKVGHDETTYYRATVVNYSTRLNPDSEFWSYEAGPIVSPPGARFIDQAGDDFFDIIQQAFDDLSALRDRCAYVIAGVSVEYPTPIGDNRNVQFGNSVSSGLSAFPFPYGDWPNPIPSRPDPYPATGTTDEMSVVVPNMLIDVDMIAEEDGCVLKLYATIASFRTNIEFSISITTEVAVPSTTPGFYTTVGVGVTQYSHVTTKSFVEVPGTREEVVVFQCEISGYGYFPSGGFSFRKTHSRSIFKPCEPAGTSKVTVFNPDDASETITNNPPATTLTHSPYENVVPNVNQGYWSNNVNALTPFVPSTPGYPDTDIQFATFGKGIFSPFYPTYVKTYIKDMLLDKWGVFSEAHSLLFDILPINRVERPAIFGDAPTYGSEFSQSNTNMGCIFIANGNNPFPALTDRNYLPCLLMNYNPYSKLVYGKIGLTRSGTTRLTGGSFCFGSDNFAQAGFVNLTIRSSLNNINYKYDDVPSNDFNVSYDIPNNRTAEIPFTLDGRWFTITLQGQFDIQYMSLYGHPAGRMRFPIVQEEDPQ